MSRFSSLNIQPRKESKLKGRAPRIGVDLTGLSKFLAAHDSFSSDTTTFDGLITGGLSTRITSDHLGGLASVSNLSFSVVNPGLFSDLFNGIDPENERVQTFLYFDDGSSILDAEQVQLFDGTISNFPDISYDAVIFEAEPLDVRLNTMIGTLLTDSDAADTNQGLPEDSRGKIRPIVYGDHTILKANNSKALDTLLTNNNLVPCTYLGIDSSSKHRWFVADHIVNELINDSADSEQQQIWGFDSTINRFVRLATAFTIEQNTSDGCIISHANDPFFFDYWYPRGTVTKGQSGLVTSPVPLADLADRDFTSKATGSIDPLAFAGDFFQVVIPFPEYDNQGLADDDISEIKNLLYVKATLAGGAASGDYSVNLDGVAIPDPEGASFPDARSEAIVATHNLSDISTDLILRGVCDVSLQSGESVTLEFYDVYRQIKYTRRTLLPLYFGGKGKEYGVYLNGRSTTEGFTETHADDDTEGSLIENGAGVIESILREDTGFTLVTNGNFATDSDWTKGANWSIAGGKATKVPSGIAILSQDGILIIGQTYQITFRVRDRSGGTITMNCGSGTTGTSRNAIGYYTEILKCSGSTDLEFKSSSGADLSIDDVSISPISINQDSLNIASNDLSTTKLSFGIFEQIESNTLIDSILKTLGSVGHYDEQNRFRMRTYVSGDGFGVSTFNAAAAEDIIDFDPQTVFKIVTGVNDKLQFVDGAAANHNTIMTAGTYSGRELAVEIKIQFEAASAKDYTISYSTSTGKFTLVEDGGLNWELEWANTVNTTITRLLGFDTNAPDSGSNSYTSDFPVFENSLLFHPMIENTFTLKKVDDDIVTNFTVEYFQEYVSNRFQKTVTATDTTFHAETLKRTWQHSYTRDQTTVEFYRDFLKVRLRRKKYEGTLVTLLSAVGFEPWDFVNIRHPILNGIFGSNEETTKWIVTDIGLNAETMEYEIGVVES